MAAPRAFNSGFLQNGAAALPHSSTTLLLPNQGRVVQSGPIRILCIADIRGHMKSLNYLAKQARADYIIHTGDFGFYDESSLDRIVEKTLKHVTQYSPLISDAVKKVIQQGGNGSVKSRFSASEIPLSELPLLINGDIKLNVPVYTVWGACEDVRVLERFRSSEYKVPNLHIIDEARSLLLESGGVKLRLLGLGGAVVMHKLFDNGEGRTTIAGGQGTMWTTLLQMGELIDTAHRVYDPTETRLFITHASPAREGILNQLAVTLKADFSISGGLHFRYGSSYNEFSVNPTLDHYLGKLAASKASFNDVWETVKSEVEPVIQQNEAQQNLLKNALQLVNRMPSTAAGGNPFGGPACGGQVAVGQVDESAFKNMWNFNLADAAFGYLVLEVQDGRIGTEMRAQGFNFSHRATKQQSAAASPPQAGRLSGFPAPTPATTQSPVMTLPTGREQTALQASSCTVASTATHSSKMAEPPAGSGSGDSKPARKDKATVSANGSANGPEQAPPSTSKAQASDIIGLFVMNVSNDDQCRELFDAESKGTILNIEKWGVQNKVVHFKTMEERDAAFGTLPNEVKTRAQEDRSRPLVKIFQAHARPFGNRGVAGNWGGNLRSCATASGYKSAGGTSDSENNRRATRGGRGGRGGERSRGRARGMRGDGSASSVAAPETPVTPVAE